MNIGMLVNTAGELLPTGGFILLLIQLRPHPLPQDVIPMTTHCPSARGHSKGPPESPCGIQQVLTLLIH